VDLRGLGCDCLQRHACLGVAWRHSKLTRWLCHFISSRKASSNQLWNSTHAGSHARAEEERPGAHRTMCHRLLVLRPYILLVGGPYETSETAFNRDGWPHYVNTQSVNPSNSRGYSRSPTHCYRRTCVACLCVYRTIKLASSETKEAKFTNKLLHLSNSMFITWGQFSLSGCLTTGCYTVLV
jgi:hypothetical protein